MSEKIRNEIFTKLKKGIGTKYINDLKLMKDFNNEIEPYKQDKVLECFFDEMVRMFIEFKMAFENPYNFKMASFRLNQYLNEAHQILQFNHTEAMIKKKLLLREIRKRIDSNKEPKIDLRSQSVEKWLGKMKPSEKAEIENEESYTGITPKERRKII
jgi:hypothetical protein